MADGGPINRWASGSGIGGSRGWYSKMWDLEAQFRYVFGDGGVHEVDEGADDEDGIGLVGGVEMVRSIGGRGRRIAWD